MSWLVLREEHSLNGYSVYRVFPLKVGCVHLCYIKCACFGDIAALARYDSALIKYDKVVNIKSRYEHVLLKSL